MTITLSNLNAPTFGENAVNGAPQLIDSDVTVTLGGAGCVWIAVRGLLPEDKVGILSEGRVGYNAATGVVTIDGAPVGVARTLDDGAFYIEMSGTASAVVTELIVEHLTYANGSNDPTATRALTIELGDTGLWSRSGVLLTEVFPSKISLGDVDGDGDLDMLVTVNEGRAFLDTPGLRYFENTGTSTAPAFVERTGGDNLFGDIAAQLTYGTAIEEGTLYDWDGDGDLDMIFRYTANTPTTFLKNAGIAWNVGDAEHPQYVLGALEWDGRSLFDGIMHIVFADLDGDGHDELIGSVGDEFTNGYVNIRTQADVLGVPDWRGYRYYWSPDSLDQVMNPDGGRHGYYDVAVLDQDRDGDLDILVRTGSYRFLGEATGDPTNPTYVWRIGNIITPEDLAPGLAVGDLNGDGRADFITIAAHNLRWYWDPTVLTPLLVTVTPEPEVIVGAATPDTLTGTAGADTVQGLDGDDLLGGGAGDDRLEGGDGDDYLRGGSGADTMIGGLGNDTYVVADLGDTADETAGGGIDIVLTSISFTLGAGLDNLTLTAPGGAIDGTGNALDNVILGNAFENTIIGLDGADTLSGNGRNDVLYGENGNDILDGGQHDDQLFGGADHDVLTGGTGNDRLDGGTGADDMAGGAGADVYIVDSLLDTVTETANEGTDTVESSVDWTLGANLENLTLTGSADLAGTGNGLRNTIIGNDGGNIIQAGGELDTVSGGAGDNQLYGEAGNDVLNGGADDDVLTGGAGADKLTGGAGADRFVFGQADITTPVGRDEIFDLTFAGGDVIDLSGIDANTTPGADGDQAFVWAARFTKVAGQAVMAYASGITTLSLDVNGDGAADFRIAITGDHTGAKDNLYTGVGDANGGWIL